MHSALSNKQTVRLAMTDCLTTNPRHRNERLTNRVRWCCLCFIFKWAKLMRDEFFETPVSWVGVALLVGDWWEDSELFIPVSGIRRESVSHCRLKICLLHGAECIEKDMLSFMWKSSTKDFCTPKMSHMTRHEFEILKVAREMVSVFNCRWQKLLKHAPLVKWGKSTVDFWDRIPDRLIVTSRKTMRSPELMKQPERTTVDYPY